MLTDAVREAMAAAAALGGARAAAELLAEAVREAGSYEDVADTTVYRTGASWHFVVQLDGSDYLSCLVRDGDDLLRVNLVRRGRHYVAPPVSVRGKDPQCFRRR